MPHDFELADSNSPPRQRALLVCIERLDPGHDLSECPSGLALLGGVAEEIVASTADLHQVDLRRCNRAGELVARGACVFAPDRARQRLNLRRISAVERQAGGETVAQRIARRARPSGARLWTGAPERIEPVGETLAVLFDGTCRVVVRRIRSDAIRVTLPGNLAGSRLDRGLLLGDRIANRAESKGNRRVDQRAGRPRDG